MYCTQTIKQEGQPLFYVTTFWQAHSYHWKEVPIFDEIITQVHKLAMDEGQPKLTNGISIFEWNDGHEIIDESVDLDEGDNVLGSSIAIGYDDSTQQTFINDNMIIMQEGDKAKHNDTEFGDDSQQVDTDFFQDESNFDQIDR